MRTPKMMRVYSLAVAVGALVFAGGADAQYRDRTRASQGAQENTDSRPDRDGPARRARPEDRQDRPDMSAPRSRTRTQAEPRTRDLRRAAAPPRDRQRRTTQDRDRRRQETQDRDRQRRTTQDRDRQRPAAQDRDRQRRTIQDRDRQRRATEDRDRQRRITRGHDRQRAAPPRRLYDREHERRWHRDRPRARPPVYVPHRWDRRDRPYYRKLWPRRYSRVWWCGLDCRILLLFGFGVWAVDTVVSYDSSYSFPIWEALEYNPTGETSLWESRWGYVEFTPTRTYKRRFGRFLRDCRDYLRVVVRNDGFERRYEGTACRNPAGVWWIVASYRVFP